MLKRIPKPILYTVIYYITAVLLEVYFSSSKAFKSGPCTPNLDVLWPFAAFLGAIFLCLIYSIRTLMKLGKANLYALLINLGMIGLVMIFLMLTDH